MSNKKHQSLNPSDARIKIRYRKGRNPQVKFKYVNKMSPFWIVWISLFFSGINLSYLSIILIFFADLIRIYNSVGKSIPLFYHTLIIFMFFLPSIIFTIVLISNKRLLKLMPEINLALNGGLKYKVIFKPKDIKENKCSIPVFKNIGLDYKAKGDFSKYMEGFDIVELPLKRMDKDGKLKPQNAWWKAEWSFTQPVKTGQMEVLFN